MRYSGPRRGPTTSAAFGATDLIWSAAGNLGQAYFFLPFLSGLSTGSTGQGSLRSVKNQIAWIVLGVSLAGPVWAAGGGGLFDINPTRVGMNIVLFLLLMIPTKKFLIDPLVRTLALRDEQTAGASDQAEAVAAEAARAERELGTRLEQVGDRVTDARRRILSEAEQRERELIASARDAATTEVDKVRNAVGEELVASRAVLHNDARVIARDIADKLLRSDS